MHVAGGYGKAIWRSHSVLRSIKRLGYPIRLASVYAYLVRTVEDPGYCQGNKVSRHVFVCVWDIEAFLGVVKKGACSATIEPEAMFTSV